MTEQQLRKQAGEDVEGELALDGREWETLWRDGEATVKLLREDEGQVQAGDEKRGDDRWEVLWRDDDSTVKLMRDGGDEAMARALDGLKDVKKEEEEEEEEEIEEEEIEEEEEEEEEQRRGAVEDLEKEEKRKEEMRERKKKDKGQAGIMENLRGAEPHQRVQGMLIEFGGQRGKEDSDEPKARRGIVQVPQLRGGGSREGGCAGARTMPILEWLAFRQGALHGGDGTLRGGGAAMAFETEMLQREGQEGDERVQVWEEGVGEGVGVGVGEGEGGELSYIGQGRNNGADGSVAVARVKRDIIGCAMQAAYGDRNISAADKAFYNGGKRALCLAVGCDRTASFGHVSNRRRVACKAHKGSGHVDLCMIGCVCKHNGCERIASFGLASDRIRLFCASHKVESHINLKTRRCTVDKCQATAIYGNLSSARALFCGEHRSATDLDMRSKRCKFESCRKQPGAGHEYCAEHRPPNEVVASRKRKSRKRGKTCEEKGCRVRATYGAGRPRACSLHKRRGERDLVSKMCEAQGCSKQASFCVVTKNEAPMGAAEGHRVVTSSFCTGHKPKGVEAASFRNRQCQQVPLYTAPPPP